MSKVLSIRVTGAVQGIGYRPYIARLAEKLNLAGEVRNTGGIVTILAAGSSSAVDSFVQTVRTKVPAGGLIVSVDVCDVTDRYTEAPQQFRICGSETEQADDLPVFPPDIGICEACAAEMEDPSDRRYRYPLISCASCGPRWSILRRFPYDRDTTAMLPYGMCPVCGREYTTGRRRHAQTISCHDCGPQMVLYGSDETGSVRVDSTSMNTAGYDSPDNTAVHRTADDDLMKAAEILQRGGILAAKSVGGYQLMCLAGDAAAVKRLRKMKGREKKPFAVLFHDVGAVRQYCAVTEKEEELLRSSARPIVLLEPAAAGEAGEPTEFPPEVSAESRRIGAFLPSAGFQTLLTGMCGPLIVTSCNLTDGPILTREEDLLAFIRQSEDPPDAVYGHDREILRPLDDSVLSVVAGEAQMIRRSRGYVPMPVFVKRGIPSGAAVLALGGDLKSTFCLMKHDRAILSQYYGDLAEYGVYENYTRGIRDMADVFAVKPEVIVTDMHPGYLSSSHGKELAEELSEGRDRPVLGIRVQHHHAHIASVMAEHGLDSCIGIAFDGTGYGTDGQLWGGEFLYCSGASFEREASLSPIRLCGGDRAAKDAELAACCLIASCGDLQNVSRISPGKEQMVWAALANSINTVSCTSMGRLFDAAAFLLGIKTENSYEGECAISLENAAIRAAKRLFSGNPAESTADGDEAELIRAVLHREDLRNLVKRLFPALVREEGGRLLLSQESLARGIANVMQEENGVPFHTGEETGASFDTEEENERPGGRDEAADLAALLFHMAILEGSVQICREIRAKTGEDTVALSGGSFQNRILAEGAVHLLRNEGFHVYLNRLVPPNDGGISLGQAFIAARMLQEPES